MSTITAMEIQKRRPDRVNIQLDGEYAFSLAAILAVGLKVGQRLEPERLAALQAQDADETAYQRALRLLGRRPRSESELRTYLLRHKTLPDSLERTLARLREHRHADDAQFARAWVENRSAFRPRGRKALAWELRQKGVPAAAAELALGDIDESQLAYQAGLKKARQLATADWRAFRASIAAYLSRRGFPSSVVGSTISRLWTEFHPGQPPLTEEDIP